MSQIPSPSVCRGPKIVRGGGSVFLRICFVFSCPNQWVVLTLMWHIKPEAPKKGATRLWSQFDWLAAGLWAFDFLFDFNVTWCTPAQKHFFFERHNPLLYHAWSMGRRCARHAEDPGNSTNRKSNITGFMCNWAAYWNKRGPVPLHRVLIPGPSQATGAGWREFFLWTDKMMLRISLLIKHVSNIFEFCIVYVHIHWRAVFFFFLVIPGALLCFPWHVITVGGTARNWKICRSRCA